MQKASKKQPTTTLGPKLSSEKKMEWLWLWWMLSSFCFCTTLKHEKCWKEKLHRFSRKSVVRPVVSWMWWYRISYWSVHLNFRCSMNLSPTSHVRVCSSVCLAALQTTAGLFSALADNLFLSPLVDFYIFLGQLAMECMSWWCPSHLWHSINCMVCWWNAQSPCHIPSSIT